MSLEGNYSFAGIGAAEAKDRENEHRNEQLHWMLNSLIHATFGHISYSILRFEVRSVNTASTL